MIFHRKSRCLEPFQICCSHSGEWIERAVFLVFGFRLRQGYDGTSRFGSVTGFLNLLLRRTFAKAKKSSLRIGYNFFSNAQARFFAAISIAGAVLPLCLFGATGIAADNPLAGKPVLGRN